MKLPLFLFLLSLVPAFALEGWENDLDTAKIKAQEEGKDLFIVYKTETYDPAATGRIERMFTIPYFTEQLSSKYVLVELPAPDGMIDKPPHINLGMADDFAKTSFTITLSSSEGHTYFEADAPSNDPYSLLAKIEASRENREKILPLYQKIFHSSGEEQMRAYSELVKQFPDCHSYNSLFTEWEKDLKAGRKKDVGGILNLRLEEKKRKNKLSLAITEADIFCKSLYEDNEFTWEEGSPRINSFIQELMEWDISTEGKSFLVTFVAMTALGRIAVDEANGLEYHKTHLEKFLTKMNEYQQELDPGSKIFANIKNYFIQFLELDPLIKTLSPLKETNPEEGVRLIEEYKNRKDIDLHLPLKLILEQIHGLFLIYQGKVDQGLNVWDSAVNLAPWTQQAQDIEEASNRVKQNKKIILTLLEEKNKGNFDRIELLSEILTIRLFFDHHYSVNVSENAEKQ